MVSQISCNLTKYPVIKEKHTSFLENAVDNVIRGNEKVIAATLGGLAITGDLFLDRKKIHSCNVFQISFFKYKCM